MDSITSETVFGFTREEWFRAYSFDQTDEEALAKVDALFAAHAEGSDGFVFQHYDMLRLTYVSDDCRARILSLLGTGGGKPALLEKLRLMDRDTRSGGRLRRWPVSDPL